MQEEIQKAKRKYIKMFFEAQVITQEIRIGNNGLQGEVYLYHSNDAQTTNGQKTLLTYIPYESKNGGNSFTTMLQNNDPSIQNYFSVNNGQLILASLETTEVTILTEEEGDLFSLPHKEDPVYKATEVAIDYKSMISQYTTPMSFFLILGMTSRNPEFLAAVADLVKDNTRIELTVLNTTTVETTVRVDNYTENTYKISVVNDSFTGTTIVTGNKEKDLITKEVEKTTTTVVTTVVPTVRVTSVDTWICSQDITYTKIPGEPIVEDPVTIPQESDPPKSPSANPTHDETITWITREPSTVNVTTTIESYDAGTASAYVDNTDSFINLLDVEYKIPNSKTKRTAGAYLRTDAEMLFDLLLQNPETQGMEKVMRYIMYRYTGKDYGVTDLDFSMFDPNYFSNVSGLIGSSVEDKFWYALKRLGYSNEAIAGAMGNIKCESGFSTTATNSSSGAYGLAQWMGGRLDNLKSYATSQGTTEADENAQIEFLIAEITGTGDAADYATRRTAGGRGENYHTYDDWANSSSVEEAAVAYCLFFETPSTSSEKTDYIIQEENRRIVAAKEYYEEYNNREMGGTYLPSNDGYGVKGYYTASNGRTFTILNQNAISGWGDKCNRAACAIIASGYSTQTSTELINYMNSNYSGAIYGAIPTNYWDAYNLKIDGYETPSNYIPRLREQLTSGGYALLWLNNGGTYIGKSGTVWTKQYHWIAIIDYKYENGTDKICVADWRGITWVNIDEFETYGVTRAVYVSEK